MPLVREHEQVEFERFDGIYFWMRDRTNCVLCKVSHEALRDRSAKDGWNASLPDTFVHHRQRIETIAGEKYDEGHRPNDLVLVLSRDLTPPPQVIARESKVIAIVDDHHDSRDAIADLARLLGYTAISFQSADAFLNSGRVGEVTCLISDILMPGKNGLDLHRELLAGGHRMPVIFTSGLPQSQDDYPGAVGFLNKPFHDEALIKCLKLACGEPVGQS